MPWWTHAVFTHEGGEVKRSLMYYAGEDAYWFRFTGTKTGKWNITTEGPGALGNQTGVVQVKEGPEVRKGFPVPQAQSLALLTKIRINAKPPRLIPLWGLRFTARNQSEKLCSIFYLGPSRILVSLANR